MLKNFTIIVSIIILASLIVFLTKKPSSIYNRTFGKVLGQSIGPNTQQDSPALSPPSLINQTQSILENTSQQIEGSVKDSVFNTAQTGLDTIFNKPSNATPVSVQELDPSSSSITQQSITVVDLSKDNNLKLALPVSSKYDLQFQNTQPNQCLYINGNKYPIEDSKIIEIEFISSGSYPIKVNACDLNDKVIGEFDIQ